MDDEPRLVEELDTQPRYQVTIQLDHFELPLCRLEQGLGQRSLTWTDFHEPLAGPGADGSYQPGNDAGVTQEILAEALACAMTRGAG